MKPICNLWSRLTNREHAKKDETFSRRARRGFSMVEMTLVLIVTAMIMQTGIELATSHTKRQITQRTAATMSRVADDVQTYMERNYFNILTELTAAPNNVVERDWNAMIAANLISLDAVPLSPDGGNMRLFLTLRGDTVYSVIMSFNGNGSNYSPRPDPNTKFAGKVQGFAPTTLNGWDFSLDIPEIATLTGASLTGNVGVIRQIAQDVNIDPFLHRIAVPGRPDLNEMQADLDLGGFNLNNALTVTTRNLTVQDEMTVAGTLNANAITSSGGANVGEMVAREIIADEVNAANASISGRVQTVTAAITGDLVTNTFTGRNASFENLSTNTFSGGSVFLSTGNYIQIDVNRINAQNVIADQVFIGD